MTDKRKPRPYKSYRDLRQKQKSKISDWMFHVVCDYYGEHGMMPGDEEIDSLVRTVYTKVQGAAILVSYEDILRVFNKKQVHFSERIETNGLPIPKAPKQKKTEAEKSAIKRLQRQNRKKKKAAAFARLQDNPDQNDYFYYIAGYTSGGAPYGVTWEEMGLQPYEDSTGMDLDE